MNVGDLLRDGLLAIGRLGELQVSLENGQEHRKVVVHEALGLAGDPLWVTDIIRQRCACPSQGGAIVTGEV